jgi:hypothetical protein
VLRAFGAPGWLEKLGSVSVSAARRLARGNFGPVGVLWRLVACFMALWGTDAVASSGEVDVGDLHDGTWSQYGDDF